MIRLRLAATAALTLLAVFVTASIGEAQGEQRFRAEASCKTRHTMTRDFAKTKTNVERQARGANRAGAAAFVPAAGVKVIVKLVDLTPQNGDNVVGKARKSDITNDKGVAKTTHEFNNFGNYRLKVKAKTGGEVVARDTIEFGVSDRVDGECDPPLTGRP